jgi:hypothetical protein
MSFVKKAHTVPRTYLTNFSKDGEFLWVYNKQDGKIFKTNIDNISTGNKFYNLDHLGYNKESSALEDQLGEIEGRYSQNFNKLNLNDWIIDLETKAYFLEFLTLQLIRTRTMRKGVAHLLAEIKSQLLAKGFKEEHLGQYGIEIETSSEKEKHLKFLMNPFVLGEINSFLSDGIWVVIDNQTSYDFITSDHPLTLYVYQYTGITATEHFIPLTQRKGISIFSRKYFSDIAKLDNKILPLKDSEFTRHYNHRQIFTSHLQVYNSINHFPYVEKAIKLNPDLMKIDKPKFGVVVDGQSAFNNQ